MAVEGIYIDYKEERGKKYEWSINLMEREDMELIRAALEKECELLDNRIKTRVLAIGTPGNSDRILELGAKKVRATRLIRLIELELKKIC